MMNFVSEMVMFALNMMNSDRRRGVTHFVTELDVDSFSLFVFPVGYAIATAIIFTTE